jgi:hypothetical protein
LHLIRDAALKLIQQVIHSVNIVRHLGIERMPFFVRLLRCVSLPANDLNQVANQVNSYGSICPDELKTL